MDKVEKQQILERAKKWMREELIAKHIRNTKKLSLSSFNINPFLWEYLASFLDGNVNSEALARALILPRVLGTSITTSFGQNLQSFITETMGSSVVGSTTSGIDIEFIDKLDGRRKYAQLKAGPNVINKDDVKTIVDHFDAFLRLARTNNKKVQHDDAMLCLLYGSKDSVNTHIKKIEDRYPVLVGEEFRYHLTGDKGFYGALINAIREVTSEVDTEEIISDAVNKLARSIEKKYPQYQSSKVR